MHALLISEKPSLMQQIQEVYEKHKAKIPYTVHFLSQRGHLLTLKNPDEIDPEQKNWAWEAIPFFPEEHGGWQYKIIEEKKTGRFLTSKERYDMIKKELKSGGYDFVINAGDPDQEGELLIQIVLSSLKNTLPVKRFWTNDLTESHILNALINLKDDDKDPMLTNLLKAGYGRQHLDYIFGINLTRAATLKMNARVACGRVKTPILSVVCKREEEIANFKPKTVYGVRANYEDGFPGVYFIKSETEEVPEDEDDEEKNGIVWFDTKKEASDFITGLPKQAEVISFEEKEVKTNAPKQFKLATLQVEAGKYGYNDSQTLSIIQSLYEKKLLSYPRTDCEYLSSEEDFMGILGVLNAIPQFSPFVKTITKGDLERVKKSKRWINDKALEESGHSAIRPTTQVPDFSMLSKEEADIYTIVSKRFISMFLKPITQMKTRLVAKIGPNTFMSSGKRLIDAGFSKIYGTKFTDVSIPVKAVGDILTVNGFDIPEKTSVCPKRFTSPDLIAVCENPAKYLEDKSLKTVHGKLLKIGTPATRSSIITQLIEVDKYLQTQKNGKREVVVPTEKGMKIIKNLGPCDICKIDLTGELEKNLESVRDGSKSLDEFEKQTREHVIKMIQNIKDTPMTPFESKTATKVVGTCPKCGMDIIESEKGFSCRGYKKDGSGCNIKLWKSKFGTTFTVEDAMELWSGKSVTKEISVSLITKKQKIRYNFAAYDAEFDTDEAKAVTACPCCGKTVVATEMEYKCESCDLKGMRFVCGAVLTDENLENLFLGNKITVTCSKDGKEWPQKLVFDKGSKRIEFYSGEPSKYKCPCCSKDNMNLSEKGYRCPACKFSFPKSLAKHEFTEEEIDTFMKDKQSKTITFIGKKGTFKAYLTIDKRKKDISFNFVK